jgi:hypothetical protein
MTHRRDRAAAVAAAILQIVAQHILDPQIAEHLTRLLADEFADERREAYSDITPDE